MTSMPCAYDLGHQLVPPTFLRNFNPFDAFLEVLNRREWRSDDGGNAGDEDETEKHERERLHPDVDDFNGALEHVT